MPFDPKKLARFPAKAGVYLMKSKEGKILYIGKATNLRQRVKQYFAAGGDGREMIPHLIAKVERIDTIVVSSEKEALILENNLIKKHQPKYNACLKDDKSYFSLAINHRHKWPMVRVVRYKGTPPSGQLYFGPYTNGHAARQTLEYLRHLFPLRQCSDRELASRTRPCILYELKRCIAPCTAKCTKEEYAALVTQVTHFLRGQDQSLFKEMQEEMQLAADRLDFERAQELLETIEHLRATTEKQRVEKAGTGDYDVIGLYRRADEVALTQLLFREGKLIATNHHLFSQNAQEDGDLVRSFLLQHYGQSAFLPKEVLLPTPLEESSMVASLLGVRLATPQKGDKKALVAMAEANAEAHFNKESEEKDKKEQVLIGMEEEFGLINYPERIECFDNSHLGGSEPVSAMVVFTRGTREPKGYRKYKIQTADSSDDYGALREVLTRRYARAKEEDNLPDLIVIDGGKGHLNVALAVLSALDVSTVDVIGVAKEEHKHTKGVTHEQVFLPGRGPPLMLKPHSPILFFLQQVRDEAHRVALSFQRQRRSKRTLASSLDTLPGIGPVKKQRLLRHFGSLKRILAASDAEILAIQGIQKKDLETLRRLGS